MVTIWQNNDLNKKFIVSNGKAFPAQDFVYDPCDGSYNINDSWTSGGTWLAGSDTDVIKTDMFYSGGNVFFQIIGSATNTTYNYNGFIQTKNIINTNSFSIVTTVGSIIVTSGTVPLFNISITDGTNEVIIGSIHHNAAASFAGNILSTINAYEDGSNIKVNHKWVRFKPDTAAVSFASDLSSDSFDSISLSNIPNVSNSYLKISSRVNGTNLTGSNFLTRVSPILLGRRRPAYP